MIKKGREREREREGRRAVIIDLSDYDDIMRHELYG
jgi:hypothetical protein